MPPTSPADTYVVEADTAEAALEQVSETIGPDAEILSAELVSAGGIGGFFAREQVRITARARRNGVDLKEPEPDTFFEPNPIDESAGGLEEMLNRMIEDADAGETTFQEALKRELRPTPIEHPSDSSESANHEEEALPEPEPEPAAKPQTADALRAAAAYDELNSTGINALITNSIDAAPGTGGIRWSLAAMTRLGLPLSLLESVVGLDPDDDTAWINALARAVVPFCRPLPHGSAVIAGPRAERLSHALGLKTYEPPELPPYGGSFVGKVTSTPRDAAWLNHVRGDRWLHIAVDDEPWRGIVKDDPIAVSWTSERGLMAALSIAATTGAVLGYGAGPVAHHGWEPTARPRVLRANPLDIALTIRAHMERE